MATLAAPPRLALATTLAIISIVVSAALAAVKITVGLHAHSVAVVSDGLENAADFFAGGLVLLGLWIASKPADEDHPYGHGRFETLTGLAIGVLLAAVGAAICVQALGRRGDQHPLHAYAMWPLIGSIVVRSEEHTSELQSRFGISY